MFESMFTLRSFEDGQVIAIYEDETQNLTHLQAKCIYSNDDIGELYYLSDLDLDIFQCLAPASNHLFYEFKA